MSQPIQKRLQDVLAPYGVQPLSNIEICATSSGNEVFFVDTARGRIALKHHMQNNSLERLQQEVALAIKLAKFDVPTPTVLHNQAGRTVTEYQSSQLYVASEFVQGSPLPAGSRLIEPQLAQLAQLLAKYHLAGADEELDLLPTHICSYDLPGLTNRLMTYRCELHTLEQCHPCAADLLALIYNAMPKAMGLSRALPDELLSQCRKSIIHGDIDYSNFLFNQQGKLVSCIDFDHARRDLRIYDLFQLAFLAVNSKYSHSAEGASDRAESWHESVELILEHYEQIAPPLNAAERQCLPIMAEVHFLHQLADYQFDVTDNQCDITISKLQCAMVNLDQDIEALTEVMAGNTQEAAG